MSTRRLWLLILSVGLITCLATLAIARSQPAPAAATTLPLYVQAPDPTGGDDNANLQAAIDGLTPGVPLLFPPGQHYRTSKSLKVWSKVAVRLACLGVTDLGSPTTSGTIIEYTGNPATRELAVL